MENEVVPTDSSGQKSEGSNFPTAFGFGDPKEKIGKRTAEAWYKYMTTPYKNMAKQALEFASRVHEFKQECIIQDKNFGEAAGSWLDLNKDAASEWAIIGKNVDRIAVLDYVPTGRKVLAQLSRLKDECFDEFVESDIATAPFGQGKLEKFVIDYSNRLSPPREPSEIPESLQVVFNDSTNEVDEPPEDWCDDENVVADLSEYDEMYEQDELEDEQDREEEAQETAGQREKRESDQIRENYEGAIDDLAGLLVERPDIAAMLQSYYHPDKPTGDIDVSARLNSIVPAIKKYVRLYAGAED